jgi:hypothetical protein
MVLEVIIEVGMQKGEEMVLEDYVLGWDYRAAKTLHNRPRKLTRELRNVHL